MKVTLSPQILEVADEGGVADAVGDQIVLV